MPNAAIGIENWQAGPPITAKYRIFGPPGIGKTTRLTRQIRSFVKRFGQDSVLVASFSRAAAAELAGRISQSRPRCSTSLALLAHTLSARASLVRFSKSTSCIFQNFPCAPAAAVSCASIALGFEAAGACSKIRRTTLVFWSNPSMTLADRAQRKDSTPEKKRMVMGALSEPRKVETD